jgi:hypothetical protein
MPFDEIASALRQFWEYFPERLYIRVTRPKALDASNRSLEGIDTLTSRRQEMSSLTSQFMLPRLSHRSKIDGRRFEIVDASDGSSNAVEH